MPWGRARDVGNRPTHAAAFREAEGLLESSITALTESARCARSSKQSSTGPACLCQSRPPIWPVKRAGQHLGAIKDQGERHGESGEPESTDQWSKEKGQALRAARAKKLTVVPERRLKAGEQQQESLGGSQRDRAEGWRQESRRGVYLMTSPGLDSEEP